MNFYMCRHDIKKYLNNRDINFLHELSRIAEGYHSENIYSRVGYEVLGPALLGYSSWLHDEAEKSGADMLVFLAREGRIMKYAYDHLFSHDDIKTSYIHVSRISLCRASIVYTKNLDDVLRLFTHTLMDGRRNVLELFNILGIIKYADSYSDVNFNISDIYDREELYGFIITRKKTSASVACTP